MSHLRFKSINYYIHLVDKSNLEEDCNHLGYNQIRKVRWLVESFVTIS
jgi:hypothetical protein